MAEDRHGRSPAAWTAVAILLVASLLISVAVVVTSWPLAILGMVLIVVGVVVGKLLAMAGLGRGKPDESNESTAIR